MSSIISFCDWVGLEAVFSFTTAQIDKSYYFFIWGGLMAAGVITALLFV